MSESTNPGFEEALRNQGLLAPYLEDASPALKSAYEDIAEARRVYDPIVQWLGTRRDMPLNAGNLQDALEALRALQFAENRFWMTWVTELRSKG